MTTNNPDATADLALRGWKPSSSAAQRMKQQAELGLTAIVDDSEAETPIRRVLSFLARPFVKLIIGLALFISAAIVYDTTINYGSWTEKAAKAKATNHRGLAGPAKPQLMPD